MNKYLIDSTIYFQQRTGDLMYLPNTTKPYSGEDLCVWKYASGQYWQKGEIKNGKKHGKYTVWFQNGQIGNEANYKDGKFDGKYTSWKNGQISAERIYKDDECISGDC